MRKLLLIRWAIKKTVINDTINLNKLSEYGFSKKIKKIKNKKIKEELINDVDFFQ